MIAALLFAATSVQGSVRTVELSRGALIQPSDSTAKPFVYWDMSDTYIDGSASDDNFGGEPILGGGPSKTILLRFGDLNRVLGGTRRVRKATLFLTIAGGDKPILKSVDRLNVAWSPGPYFTINALISRSLLQKPDEKKPANPEKPAPARWSATWRHRLAGDGGASWQQAGASGPQDAELISGAKLDATDKVVVIDGLATAVQQMANLPYANNGLAIHFQNECEFFASRAAVGQPRLELELEPFDLPTGPDLSVTTIEQISKTSDKPADGEEVTYNAHVKNVGTAKASGFSAVWTVNGKIGATVDVADSLEPGTETILTTHALFHLDKTDHRTQTVAVKIMPKGADADTNNNALQIYANARQIDVVVPNAVAKAQTANLAGSHAVEDWVQEQIRIFNDGYAAQSRFSFAPDGAKERVSVQHILIGTEKSSDGAHISGVATIPDGESNWLGADIEFLRSIALAAGLPDFRTMSFPKGQRVLLQQAGKPVNRGSTDIYPGLTGYGDTRYEGSLPGQTTLIYEPYASQSAGLIPLVPTGLLCATDVAILNSKLGGQDAPLTMPKSTLIKALDVGGRPLGNISMDFFQSKNGKIPDGAPSFTETSGQNEGTTLLPNKDGFGPFGKLESDGGNGAFLIRATSNGVTQWGWLKAWEVIDTASRGNISAGVLEVRFNMPSAPLDLETDLARDRIVTDSTNQLPAKLAALVSATPDSDVELGAKTGDWVEIDLGRDRTIGNISLLGSPDAFWPKFDIVVYATGQKLGEASAWAKEINWDWAASNRSDDVIGDAKTVSVGYAAPASRIRFIRIINRSDAVGKLKGIRVTPAKIAQ